MAAAVENVQQVVKEAVAQAPQVVQQVVTEAVKQVTQAPQVVQKVVTEAIKQVTQAPQVVTEAVKQVVRTRAPQVVTEAVKQVVQQIVTQAPQVVQQVVTEAVTQAPQVVQQIVTQAPQVVQQIVSEAVTQAPQVVQQIVTEAVTQAPQVVQQIVTEAVTQAPQVVQQIVTEAVTQAPQVVQQVVTEAVTQAPQVVQEVVAEVVETVTETVKENIPRVTRKLVRKVVDQVSESPEFNDISKETLESGHVQQIVEEVVKESIEQASQEPETRGRIAEKVHIVQQAIVDKTRRMLPEFGKIPEHIEDFCEKNANEGSSNLFLMSSIFPTIIIFSVYIVFVKLIGPKLTSVNRKLTKTLFLYSAFQILLNSYLLYTLNDSQWLMKYAGKCKLDGLRDVDERLMTTFCWFYFLTKFVDLLGPILLTIGRQFDQVSGLSLFYDGFVVVSVWFAVKFMPGGALSIFILADAFVHIFSHFYYLVMSYTPKKRSKTLLGLRLVQVAVLVLNALELVLFNNCGFPFAFAVWISAHAAILFIIFGRKCKKPAKRKEKSECEPYYVESTYVSYNNYERNNNLDFDIKRRYITTLKAQV